MNESFGFERRFAACRYEGKLHVKIFVQMIDSCHCTEFFLVPSIVMMLFQHKDGILDSAFPCLGG